MWSLGCVLYEMCCLKHAFAGDNLLGLLYKICEGDLPGLPEQYDDQLRYYKTLGDHLEITFVLMVTQVYDCFFNAAESCRKTFS